MYVCQSRDNFSPSVSAGMVALRRAGGRLLSKFKSQICEGSEVACEGKQQCARSIDGGVIDKNVSSKSRAGR